MKPREVRTAKDARALIEGRDTDHVVIGVPDLQGFLRGKYISRNKALGALEKGLGLPGVIYALDPTDVILEVPGLSDDSVGYDDSMVELLPETCREIPWEAPHRSLFFLGQFTGAVAKLCPRGVYQRVAARAADMGLRPFHGCELEFTLFDETAQSAHAKGYRNLAISSPFKAYELLLRQEVRAEFHNGLLDMCRAMDIEVETVHEEMGPGFMEASLAYDEGVAAPDKAVIFKTFAKAYAQRQGKLITFMARWSNEADGQSGHIHMSLRDKDGHPVFHDPHGEHGMSRAMRHFIGGLQKLVPDFLVLLGPNVNSFKRYVPGIFAPIAATWGIENRTCSFRVIPGGSPKSMRFECRTPGADANPYLSMAALLGAGLWGMEHGIEPTAPTTGNVYAQEVPEALRFPATYSEAVERFAASEAAHALFGSEFVEFYATSRRSHEASFRGLVTDRELERFFEFS